MSKASVPPILFRTGSLKSLKVGINAILQSFPKFFSKTYYPVLTVYPATETTAMSFKLRLIGYPQDIAPLPVFASMVREVMRQNSFSCEVEQALILSPKAPTAQVLGKSQKYVLAGLLNKKTADPELFNKLPVMTRAEYDTAVASEEVASDMLYRGELSLLDYLNVLLPQIQGQKTVLLLASSSNAVYAADFFNAHYLPAGAISAGTSLAERKSLVEGLRSGHLAVLVFDRPTADGEVRDELPMELGLVDRAPQDEVIDVSNKAYAEPPLDWRLVPNPAMILKLFPAKPTSDDLLDLFELSRKLRSNLLEQRVRKLTPV